MDSDFELLRELTETSGVPGYEDRVRDIVRREFDGVVDSIRTDAMGNVVGTLEGATDTAGFQNTHGAKPVGAISVPTRYLHTVTESVHHSDVDAAIDLLTGFLETETGNHDYSL